uniref:Uncharacterized protein n=1 Tax=Parascaris equorum TaxID=6256 RepID=A0A914RWM9_PAREQ
MHPKKVHCKNLIKRSKNKSPLYTSAKNCAKNRTTSSRNQGTEAVFVAYMGDGRKNR